jgi:enoyl-[acyl-carrier protein] reductase III
MTDLFSLAGQRALITGGTRGIGRAISLRLGAAGAAVLANYVRDQQAADELKEHAAAHGWSIDTCRADITSQNGLDQLLESVDSYPEKLSVFVHCAATGVHRPLEQITVRQFDWTYSLNVRAFLELVQRLLPRFETDARILAISSEGAVRAVPQYALVGSSKAALESLMRHVAVELAPRGIRVNALAPGPVLTDAWKALPDSEGRLAGAALRSPLGRLNTLDEVAWAAHFLCSKASSGVIGQTLVVDGGVGVVS